MSERALKQVRHAMMRFMARMMPSCKEISADVSAAMDRGLSLRKRLSIRLHLMMCAFCRRYEKQLKLLRGGARHYANPEENEIEDSLTPDARERLQRKLTERR